MKNIWQELGKRPLVAASLGGGERLVDAARRASKLGADLLEVRVDTLKPKERQNISSILQAVKDISSCPIIVTVRSPAEQAPSQKTSVDERERQIIFEDSLPFADAIDVEIESKAEMNELLGKARAKGAKIILSYHDFTGIPRPDKLASLLKSFEGMGGDILKIAGMAKTYEDVTRIFSLSMALAGTQRIVIGMGEAGRISRVAGFLYGSCITYGFMNTPTAPGQLSVEELIDSCALFYPTYARARVKKG